ncbi:MAG: AI-2E family transporter [Myxococcales bacterium]|nr:AI-2E family transporter [Myxococcales bacterium]
MAGAVAALFLVLSLFKGVAVPVLLALALAYSLNPVVSWLGARGLGRGLGTAAVFAAMALCLVGFVLYLIPVFRAEAQKLPEFFRRASSQLNPWVEARFGVPLPELLRDRATELGEDAAGLLESAGPSLAKVLGAFAGNTARFIATVVGLLVVPVLGFFFLKDYPRLVELGKGLVPRRAVALVGRRFSEVDLVLSAFLRGQLTVGAILSAMYAIGLSIARVDMAIVIGLIAGFGNMVPYLGTAIGLALALLGLVLSWQGPWQLAVVAATFVIAQLAEGTVITPRVVGERVGLPPVAVIVAVLAFGELFGLVGVLLAVPASAVLKVVLKVVIERYRKSAVYTGEAALK